jgi:hypothetical protein
VRGGASRKNLALVAVPVSDVDCAKTFYTEKAGFNKPSKNNEAAFYSAVEDIARISERLLASLETTAAPKDRDE